MGWGYRQSFGIGSFKLTASKSGINQSARVKGVRTTSGLRGTYIAVGSGGFFYRQKIDVAKNIPKNQSTFQTRARVTSDAVTITQGDIEQLRSVSPKKLLAEIEQKQGLVSILSTVNIVFSVVAIIILLLNVYLLVVWIPCWVGVGMWASQQDFKRKSISLFYSLDKSATHKFEKMGEGVRQLALSKSIWWIETETVVTDQRRNAGAASNIKRNLAFAALALPYYFITNIDIPSIIAGDIILYFFPDIIMIYQGNQFAALPYQQLSFSSNTTRFIETESIPSDSRTVGNTWKYVRIDGGPDRRFKNNCRIPIMEYGEITIRGQSLNICLHVSKVEAANAFVSGVKEFQCEVIPQTFESVKEKVSRLTNAQKTLAEIERIIYTNPVTVQDFIRRAEARIQADDSLEAIADLTEAIRLDPNDAVIYYMRGMLRGKLGDRMGADDDFQKIIEL